MSLAIFDLDNTLIGGDSDHSWGQFLVENELVDSVYFKAQNDRFYADYCRGKLDIVAYQRFALEPLKHYSGDQLAELHQQFMQQKIEPIWLDKAVTLIEKHKKQGDTLLVITATNRFVTEPIVEKLKIPNLLATEGVQVNGRYNGDILGIPCFAEGKVERLKQWLAQQQQKFELQQAYFYSDSFNDLPLLRLVGQPIAVDPDKKLSEQATTNGWPIISLR